MSGSPGGYRLTEADREETEAEAGFAGRGVKGRLRFRTLPGCPGALSLEIGIARI